MQSQREKYEFLYPIALKLKSMLSFWQAVISTAKHRGQFWELVPWSPRPVKALTHIADNVCSEALITHNLWSMKPPALLTAIHCRTAAPYVLEVVGVLKGCGVHTEHVFTRAAILNTASHTDLRGEGSCMLVTASQHDGMLMDITHAFHMIKKKFPLSVLNLPSFPLSFHPISSKKIFIGNPRKEKLD